MTFDQWIEENYPTADPYLKAVMQLAWNGGQRAILLETLFSQESIHSRFDEDRIKKEAQRQKQILM